MWRLSILSALAVVMLYYVGDVLVGQGMWPIWEWRLRVAALAAAAVGGIAASSLPRKRRQLIIAGAAILLRYSVAFLLIWYAVDKIVPGQFLLYNRDLDLAVRDLPSRRLAWHFLTT